MIRAVDTTPEWGDIVRRGWMLVIPLGLGVAAAGTDHLPVKMGVPLSCAALVLLSLRGRWDGVWVAAALCLSAGGDWFLSNRGGREGYFVAGIGLFFFAHAGYLAFALRHGRPRGWVLGALLAGYLSYYLIWLRPAIAGRTLSLAALLYLAISCVVLAGAWGMRLAGRLKWPFVAGIGLLVVSDTVISFSEFLGFGALNWLILPTYYLGQICVSWTVLARESDGGRISGKIPIGK
jgi:uncharacterized membrane protein YhhN